MAAPITHIVLTNKVFEKYFSHQDKKKFYVGTSFPDIRYLGFIPREKTHFDHVVISELDTENPFMAGMKFHAHLDRVREKFVVASDIYSHLPQSLYVTQAIKFFEDELLYEHITNWDIYKNYFLEVLEEEREFGISDENIMLWHNVLRTTFSAKPTPEGITEFVRVVGKPAEMAEEINKLVEIIKQDEKIKKYVYELYDNFEAIVEG